MAAPAINITSTLDNRGLLQAQRELDALKRNVDGASKDIGKKFQDMGKRMSDVGGKLTKSVTLPIVGLGAVAVKMAVDVDKSLREVNTLLGETGVAGEANFKELQAGVARLSGEIGIAQDALTKGLYQAISAGVPKENAFTFMEVAAKASIAGVTDVNTAVDGLTTVINAFGMDTSDAQSVADSMFAAVKGGKTTFEELSASLFQIAPAAAAANVSMAEVNAGIATLTASGVPTSVATTQMRAALVGLQRPSAEMNRIFNTLGFENAQAAIESNGLAFALGAVKDASNGNNGTLQTLLGSTEAVAAANVLAGTGADKFADELARQGDAAGSVDTAFEEMNKSTARQMEQLKVSLSNLAISIGNVLLPVLNRIVEYVKPIVERFANMDDGTKNIAVAVAVFAAALGPLLVVGGKVLQLIGGIIKAMHLLKIAFLTNPVGLVVAAIVALVAILAVAYFKFQGFRDVVDNAWQSIQAAAKEAWEGFLKPIIDQIVAAFMNDVLPALKELWSAFQEAWPKISNALSTAWGFIGPILAKIIEVYVFLYSKIIPLVIKYWTFLFTTAIAVIGVAWKIIEPILKAVGWVIMNVIVPAAMWLWSTMKTVWAGIQTAIAVAWAIIQPIFNFIAAVINTVVIPVFQFLWNTVQTVWGAISTAISVAWTIISTIFTVIATVIQAVLAVAFFVFWNVVKVVWDNVIGAINTAWGIIKPIWDTIYGFLSAVLGPVFSAFGAGVQTVFNIVWGAISSAWGFISPVFDSLKSGISSVADFFGSAVGRITGVFSGIADTIRGAFSGAFQAIKDLWNSTLGGKGFSVPDIPGVPGRGQRFEFPRFHDGGMVMGRPGVEVPAILEAGEYVLSRQMVARMTDFTSPFGAEAQLSGQSGGSTGPAGAGGSTYNITINGMVGADKRDILDFLARELPKAAANHSRSFG